MNDMTTSPQMMIEGAEVTLRPFKKADDSLIEGNFPLFVETWSCDGLVPVSFEQCFL